MITNSQKEERKNGIGGSDVAAILGLNKYKTPLDVYNEKVHGCEVEENEAMYFGNRLESVIVDEFAKRTQKFVFLTNSTFRHSKYPFLIAHVDGLIADDDSILECKNVGAYSISEWGEEGTDEIPLYYKCQVAHYCCVLEKPKAFIAVLFGGNQFKIYEYKRDMELERLIISKCQEFWKCVENKTPPLPTNLSDVLKSDFNFETMVADENIKLLYNEYLHLKSESTHYLKEANKIKERILTSCSGTGLVLDQESNLLFKISRHERTSIDTKALQKDYPEIVADYIRHTSYLKIS